MPYSCISEEYCAQSNHKTVIFIYVTLTLYNIMLCYELNWVSHVSSRDDMRQGIGVFVHEYRVNIE